MTTTPTGSDPNATPSDRLWLRSELMGTQVITRDTGRRLGVVGEVVVDIDRREVVALGLRDNPLTRFLPGLPRWMPLQSIRQVGDVILVDSADSLSEGFNPERYSTVINCQVITEAGEQLGRVLGFSFDIETGELSTLVIGALGVPLLGEGVLSTWELAVGEIVSSGTDRIIVYEGAEEKLKQLGTGLLEKLGIGGSSWEQEERERFRSGMIPAENQLPAGAPSTLEQRRIQPASSRAALPESELDYLELEERRERQPLRQRLYLDDEEERDREPMRRSDPYAEDSYGRPDYGARREPEAGWREPEPERSYSPPSRRAERYDDERFDDVHEPGGRFEERSWRNRDGQERYGDSGPARDEPDRFEAEPARAPRSDRQPPSRPEPVPSPDARPDEAYGEAASVADSRQRPGRDTMPPSRDARAQSSRRRESEPIDVEPEVLDDPW